MPPESFVAVTPTPESMPPKKSVFSHVGVGIMILLTLGIIALSALFLVYYAAAHFCTGYALDDPGARITCANPALEPFADTAGWLLIIGGMSAGLPFIIPALFAALVALYWGWKFFVNWNSRPLIKYVALTCAVMSTLSMAVFFAPVIWFFQVIFPMYFEPSEAEISKQQVDQLSLEEFYEKYHATRIYFTSEILESDQAALLEHFDLAIQVVRGLEQDQSINPEIKVEYYDLDNDQVDEIIAILIRPSICTDERCPIRVLKKENGVWQKILDMTAQDVSLADTYTNGMRDIMLNVELDTGSVGKVWRWNGTEYKWQ